MSDQEPPQISILDARLAEIDKRLRSIQTGLVTEPTQAHDTAVTQATAAELPPRVKVPEPGAAVPGLRAVAAPDDSLTEAVDELRELAAAHADLLDSMRVLLSGYELALAQAQSAPPATAAPEAMRSLTVAAGPFASTEAVRGFERALAALPGVRGVEVRGYEGGNRAIVDVHLSGATS
jgi:hypothetical protein